VAASPSAPSRRGRGLVRCRTAASWRSTRTSMFLGRTSDTTETSPRACWKITYSNRSDRRDHARPVITAGQLPRPDFCHPAGQEMLDIGPLPPVSPTSAPRVDGPAVDRHGIRPRPNPNDCPNRAGWQSRDIGNNSDFFDAQVFRRPARSSLRTLDKSAAMRKLEPGPTECSALLDVLRQRGIRQ